jgi:hypothetical protein
MAFNKEKFIADAKAAGYSDDEISAELTASSASSESSGFDQKDSSNSGWDSGRPPLVAPSVTSAAPPPKTESRVDAESKKLEQKRVEKEQQAPVIPEFVQNPLLLAGAAAAGGAAVMGWKTLKDKMASSASVAGAERREPSMFGAQRLDEPTWSASDSQHAPLSQEEMMNRLRGLAGETSVVNEPSFAQVPQAAAPATTEAPPAAPSQNLSLTEATDRMKNVVPAASVAPTVSETPAAPVPPVMSERQSAIAEADARLAAVKNSPEVQNSVWGALSSNETPAEAEARKSIGQAKLAAAIEAHDQEVRAAYKLSEAPAIQEIGPPEFTGPRRPVVPTPPAELAATTTPAPVEPPPKAKLTWPGLAEEPGPLRWTANTLGTTKDVKGSQAAFEMAKDKLTALGVDLAPVHPETGKKTGGGLIPEGHVALNDFYQTYTGESLPKGGRIESEQKLKLYDALKTHLEEAHASGTLKNLGRGAIAAASILGISEAVKAAQRGDNSKLAELGFDVGISAIPPLRTAVTALMGTTLQSGTLPNGDRDYSEVLNRPGVRQVLQNMSKVMTPAQFNAGADKYLSKVSSFPEYNSSRFTKPVIGSTQPINRRTLLPIAPPR